MEEKNEHLNKVKKSVEKVIGADLSLKRKRKTEENTRREIFERLIINLERLNVRDTLLINEFNINLNGYNEELYQVIDNLIYLHFGKKASELIFFYIYERVNPDGTTNPVQVYDVEGREVPLNTPTDLWNIISEMQKHASS